MKKFFEGVHVGDTFRFDDGVVAFKALGELTVVESLSTEAGDIKLIYDPAISDVMLLNKMSLTSWV